MTSLGDDTEIRDFLPVPPDLAANPPKDLSNPGSLRLHMHGFDKSWYPSDMTTELKLTEEVQLWEPFRSIN